MELFGKNRSREFEWRNDFSPKALTLFFLFSAVATQATEYFVSPQGSDAGQGTLSSPFKTLKFAAAKLQPGDICWLRSGTYRETLNPARSGTAASPIVVAAYGNETVVISGADTLTGWLPHEGKILKAPMKWSLGAGLNQVFESGEMVFEARFPNGTKDPMHPALAKTAVNEKGEVIFPTLSQPAGFWVGARFHGWQGYSWTAQGGIVTASGAGSLSLSSLTFPWFSGSGKGYLSGTMAALDTAGEWFWKDSLLYLWPQTPGNPQVEAKARAWTIDLHGLSHITVKNISTVAGSIRIDGENCVIEGMQARYLSHFTHHGDGYSSSAGSTLGRNGIILSGTQNEIRSSSIVYSAGSGVLMSGSLDKVTDCIIHEINYQGVYSAPISLNGSQNTVQWSAIYNGGRDLIKIESKGHRILHNDLSWPGLLCDDVGMVYAWGIDGGGVEIAWNWVHDNQSGINPGIYIDNGCKNFLVHHNVVWNCLRNSGVRINGPAQGHRIYNNTIFNADSVGSHVYNTDTTQPFEYVSINNITIRNPKSELVDTGRQQFQLVPNSPYIDKGKAVPGITDGFVGSAPDLGAYESGGEAWRAGIRSNAIPAAFPGNRSPDLHSRKAGVRATFFMSGDLLHVPKSWTQSAKNRFRLYDSKGRGIFLMAVSPGLFRIRGGAAAGPFWIEPPSL